MQIRATAPYDRPHNDHEKHEAGHHLDDAKSPFSGAALALASLLLIIPGFATDMVGFLMIFPPTRKLIFSKLTKKMSKEKKINEDFIEGESEDIDDKK